jgi:hypothetical protein
VCLNYEIGFLSDTLPKSDNPKENNYWIVKNKSKHETALPNFHLEKYEDFYMKEKDKGIK